MWRIGGSLRVISEMRGWWSRMPRLSHCQYVGSQHVTGLGAGWRPRLWCSAHLLCHRHDYLRSLYILQLQRQVHQPPISKNLLVKLNVLNIWPRFMIFNIDRRCRLVDAGLRVRVSDVTTGYENISTKIRL